MAGRGNRAWFLIGGGIALAAVTAIGLRVMVDREEPDQDPAGTTSEATVPNCRRDQLRISHEGRASASNQVADYFALKNTDERCNLKGHPDLELLGADAEPLDIPVRTGASYATYDPPIRVVTLATDDDAWFAVGSALTCHEATPARESSALRIRLPAGDVPIVVDAALPYCPDTPTVSVTSIQPTKGALAPAAEPS